MTNAFYFVNIVRDLAIAENGIMFWSGIHFGTKAQTTQTNLQYWKINNFSSFSIYL